MTKIKTIATTLLLAATYHFACAQTISNINYDEIKTATQDSASAYYYPNLLARFVTQNIPLSDKQYTYLYYGSVFTKDYDAMEINDEDNNFFDCFNKEDYQGAVKYGLKVLEKDPLYIRVLSRMSFCYKKLNDNENDRKYTSEYVNLINVILNSGDGKSVKTAYVVTKVSDEYALMESLGLKMNEQSLLGDGNTDLLEVTPTFQTPTNAGIKELYFNVSKAFEYYDKHLGGDEKQN